MALYRPRTERDGAPRRRPSRHGRRHGRDAITCAANCISMGSRFGKLFKSRRRATHRHSVSLDGTARSRQAENANHAPADTGPLLIAIWAFYQAQTWAALYLDQIILFFFWSLPTSCNSQARSTRACLVLKKFRPCSLCRIVPGIIQLIKVYIN